MPGAVFGQDLSDANLFRRVRRGDARSFGVLVHRHDPALRILASRLLADPDQVDPMLLKAYTKAWRSAAMARLGGAKGDSVAGWLYRMVYNTCVDELRRQPPHPGPEPLSGPRVRLPRAPVEQRVSALRALDAAERIPLVLVDGEGFSVRAVARILQRKPAEVAADLAAARRRWRDLVIGPPETAEEKEAASNGSKPKALGPGPSSVGDESSPQESVRPAGGRHRGGRTVAHADEGAFDGKGRGRFRRLLWGRGPSDPDALDFEDDAAAVHSNGERRLPGQEEDSGGDSPGSGGVRVLGAVPAEGVERSEEPSRDDQQDDSEGGVPASGAVRILDHVPASGEVRVLDGRMSSDDQTVEEQSDEDQQQDSTDDSHPPDGERSGGVHSEGSPPGESADSETDEVSTASPGSDS